MISDGESWFWGASDMYDFGGAEEVIAANQPRIPDITWGDYYFNITAYKGLLRVNEHGIDPEIAFKSRLIEMWDHVRLSRPLGAERLIDHYARKSAIAWKLLEAEYIDGFDIQDYAREQSRHLGQLSLM